MQPPEELNPNTDRVRPWVHRSAKLMDSQFRVPGTNIRFGLDPIVGLIPAVGDTATFAIGLAMLAEAKRLGAPLRLHAKMVGNLALDWLVGLVPGIDLVLDTAVKAHSKNAKLLEDFANSHTKFVKSQTTKTITKEPPPWTKDPLSKTNLSTTP